MSKKQVIELLGEPQEKRLSDGKEIFQYEMKDENGEAKPRIAVFEDREVVFFGKPSEWKASSSTSQTASSGNHITNTNTVSPTINVKAPEVTVAPVINIGPGSSGSSDKRVHASGNSYFHSIPLVDETKESD
jgi:hypothetical protein